VRRGKLVKLGLAGVLCLLTVAVALALWGCGGESSSETTSESVAPATTSSAAEGEPIKIGALLDYTGALAAYGPLFEEGIRLRLEEAGNTVAGRPIELVTADGQSDVAPSLDQAKKLVESDKVHATIGPLLGGVQIGLGPYFQQQKIINFSLLNLEDVLIKNGNWIGYPSTTYGSCMPLGYYAYEQLGYRKLATIGMDYAAGYSYIGGAADAFKEKGGTIVQEQWVPLGTTDFATYISNISKDADAVVLFILGADGFVKQYHEFGVEIPMLFTNATNVTFEKNLASVGSGFEGSKGTGAYTWTIDNPANKKYVDAFEEKYGRKPDEVNTVGYITTSVLLAGLEATGGDDSFDKLHAAILGLKMDTPQGPLSFTPRGVAILNEYAVEMKNVNGAYAWVVMDTFSNWTDPRY